MTHIDSATIAILVMALNELKHEHKKLSLINTPEHLKDMLEISETKDMFTIYNPEDGVYNDIKHPMEWD